jgi:Terminase-like family.
MWDYQLDFARSVARFRVVAAGRQVGKSRTLAKVSLFEASTRAGILVLVVSAGEEAAKRLLADCVALANGSESLRGSIVDDGKSLLTLSNGSTIRSVPASIRQIRGWPVDLLIIDEAGFIDNEIWDAALPAVIARPGSRVVVASSPWGSAAHWFRMLWNRGKDSPDGNYRSWQWSSYDSPLADKTLLDELRTSRSSEWFKREVLGEFSDDSGAYFSEAELMDAVADYRLCAPEDLEWWSDQRFAAAAGIDWGFAHDANALTLVSVLEDFGRNGEVLGEKLPLFIPWFEYKYRWAYTDFIARVVETARKYYLPVIASETNGVGQYPTTMLDDKMSEAGFYSAVAPVVTDVRRKQSGFGMIKGLLQSKRLVLPRDPELLKQLRGLEFEQLPGGSLRIAVPDRVGHDDVAMSFMQAVSSIRLDRAVRSDSFGEARLVPADEEFVSTKSGVQVPVRARPVSFHREAFAYPKGSESGEGW